MRKKAILTLMSSAILTGTLLVGQPSITYAAQEGTILKSVNFREAPSTSGDRIRYLKTGEQVVILEKVNKYWYKIKDHQGQIGYVTTQSRYMTVEDTSSEDTSNETSSDPSTESETIERVIEAGMKYLGTPYEFGSDRSNTRTFDCSDFVRQAFKEGVGITLPADSRKQADYVKNLGDTTTNWKNLKRGDVMFFMSYKGSKSSSYSGINKSTQRITHCGIYLGDGKILHTYSKESGGVRISDIEGTHWEYRFVFGGSALEE